MEKALLGVYEPILPRQTNSMSWSLRRGLSAAVAAIDDGNYDSADQILTDVLAKNAEAVEALIHRAYARQRAGKLVEAKMDAVKACSLRPENGVFYMILGEVQLALNENTAAYDSLKKSVSLERDNGRALYHLGRACLATGKTEEAGDFFESALQFERDYVTAQWMARRIS